MLVKGMAATVPPLGSVICGNRRVPSAERGDARQATAETIDRLGAPKLTSFARALLLEEPT